LSTSSYCEVCSARKNAQGRERYDSDPVSRITKLLNARRRKALATKERRHARLLTNRTEGS
jgi:hypothetical protein